MGRMVWCPIPARAIGAEGALDVWSLMAGASNTLKLHGWEVSSADTSAEILELRLRFVTTVGSGGQVETPVKNDADDGAITASVRTDDTAAATGVSDLQGFQWEQLGPVGLIYTPEMRPVVKQGDGIALHLVTATGFICSGWICWEEL